jgi:hypothetical protein
VVSRYRGRFLNATDKYQHKKCYIVEEAGTIGGLIVHGTEPFKHRSPPAHR